MIQHRHSFQKADGTHGLHKGKLEDCPAPECRWPQLGTLVTIPHLGGERTGKLVWRGTFAVKVKTYDDVVRVADIRGARKPDWGLYCRHGLKMIEAIPAEHKEGCQEPRPLCTLGQDDPFHECPEPEPCPACYPTGRKVRPWPCREDGCTEADHDREEQAAMDAHYEELRDIASYGY